MQPDLKVSPNSCQQKNLDNMPLACYTEPSVESSVETGKNMHFHKQYILEMRAIGLTPFHRLPQDNVNQSDRQKPYDVV